MNERELDELTLHALIDGELVEGEQAEAMKLVNENETLGLHYSEFRRLKLALGSLPTAEVPENAWRACSKRLDELDGARKTERFVSRYAWAFSASIFFLIVGAGMYNRFTGQHLGAGDVTHMASILSPLERTSNPNNGQVFKWLQDRVGPVSLNNLEVIRVVSAEAGVENGERVARLFLRDDHGPLILYVWPGTDPIDGFVPLHGGPMSEGHMMDQVCVGWSQNGCHLVLVGPRSADELEHIATILSSGAVSVGGNAN